jgi:hypothetical protein
VSKQGAPARRRAFKQKGDLHERRKAAVRSRNATPWATPAALLALDLVNAFDDVFGPALRAGAASLILVQTIRPVTIPHRGKTSDSLGSSPTPPACWIFNSIGPRNQHGGGLRIVNPSFEKTLGSSTSVR